MTGLFTPLPDESRMILDRLQGLIDKVFPLPERFRVGLPRDVAELSRLLTSGRPERGASYLGKPALLSAYLRYFLPWNIYRLSRLLTSLPLELKPNDAVNDLGAGPLTLTAALWISRPSLRNIPLEFRCLDRTPAVLDAGKKFFAALTAGTDCPWTVRTIRGDVRRNGRLSVEIRGKPATLSAAVNVYNELFWDFSPGDTDELERFTESQACLLSSLTESSGSILVVEPGIPRSGEFISLLRFFLMEEGRYPAAPCTHKGSCPMPGARTENRHGTGGKERWCHFAFDTVDAPTELHKLSAAAHIPKERAVLSFLLAGPVLSQKPIDFATNNLDKKDAHKAPKNHEKIRIISDVFHLGDGRDPGAYSWGRYGCGEHGLILVTGSKVALEETPSGALEELSLNGARDAKSGAFVAVKNKYSNKRLSQDDRYKKVE